MNSDTDILAVVLALERKLVTRDDLASTAGPAEGLGERLVARGVLSSAQLDSLRHEAASLPVPAPPSRFRILSEIGRGGLGRVAEALDLELGRTVAVKLVLDDLPAALAERFEREAQLTGRLEHPNVVPVYGFTEAPGPAGERQRLMAMKLIRGRDLGRLLSDLSKGDPATVEGYSRARLLAMFQGICLGVAYAHSKGIIHRDLKPSNVMIGDFGEVLIVDWGLAREKGAGAAAPGSAERPPVVSATAETIVPRRSSGTSAQTLEGDVIGTPAYMSPEQASGQQADVDERSDIWALGAILFEILTLRPPVQGGTVLEVLEKAKSGAVPAPSSVAGSIPADLDAICLKAMARRREDRFQTAIELHKEIQLFLEGVKERERNHRLAEEAVAKAKAAMERHARLKKEAKVAADEAKKAETGVQPWDADKSVLWGAQDRAKAVEREGVEAFSEADASLTVALSHERDHAEARRLKADLFWGKYLEAEELGDEKEMLLHRRVVEQHNDGPLNALLKGEGTLTVRTRAYACRCLLDGREVKPEELAHMGYHPFSGRALDGRKGAEGLPELEPKKPSSLKVHGESCVPEALNGADVWLYRYEEIGRRLIPTTPPEPKSCPLLPVPPPPPLDPVFYPDSPYRPQGPGIWLGRTPIEGWTVPMGSYLLLVAQEGRAPMRVPVAIPRCGHQEQDVTLFRPEEIPAGFIPIPAGPFGYQGDPENPYAGPAETKVLDDIFMARHPVTCREYCGFLNDIAKDDPEQAARRVPRQAEDAGFYWPGPPYAVPTVAWLAAAPSGLTGRRLQQSPVDWEEDWPVFGVSWEDGIAYAAWKSRREARATTLPHETEWEKSVRGVDRRFFPWGNSCDERWANGNRSKPGGVSPARVQEFVDDESPYGIRGLGGNSRDACLNDPGPEHPGWRIFRGGDWASAGALSRATYRTGFPPRNMLYSNGIRMECAVRLSGTP